MMGGIQEMVATQQVAVMEQTRLQTRLVERLINDALKTHGDAKRALIPLLQEMQNQLGYLPEWGLKLVSTRLNVPLSTIYGISTFYHQFTLKPLGKYVIQLCMGTACHVKRNAENYAFLMKTLGLGAGENTTEDRLFSVMKVRCLGCCSLAPVMKVNEDIYGQVDFAKIRRIIADYKSAERRIREPVLITIKLGGTEYKLKPDELEVLSKIGLRWGVLKCLHSVLCETRFDMPQSIDNDLEVVRSMIETGCQKPKEANALMNWVESRLIDKAISLSDMNYWEDLIWKANEGNLNQTDIEKIPYMGEIKGKYEFLSYIAPAEKKSPEAFPKVAAK
jgi:NADH-quinone oxidoreductase subunit E